MTTATSRDRIESFLETLATRDPESIGSFLADDIDWLLTGPIELFPYCGQRIGKEAVVDAYRLIASTLNITELKRDHALIDGDSVATLARIGARHESGNEVSLRVATFTRFRDGMVVEMCTIMDSLGMVEQVLGRPLDLSSENAPALASVIEYVDV
jgi:ketosteroid isomerase-like protein